MAIFLRVTAMALYLALIALGFWLVHIYRDDDSVATGQPSSGAAPPSS